MNEIAPFDIEIRFRRNHFDSINTRDWCSLLRFYRILRIRIPYAAPGTSELNGLRHNGQSYGMSRLEARHTLAEWATTIDWHEYLWSK